MLITLQVALYLDGASLHLYGSSSLVGTVLLAAADAGSSDSYDSSADAPTAKAATPAAQLLVASSGSLALDGDARVARDSSLLTDTSTTTAATGSSDSPQQQPSTYVLVNDGLIVLNSGRTLAVAGGFKLSEAGELAIQLPLPLFTTADTDTVSGTATAGTTASTDTTINTAANSAVGVSPWSLRPPPLVIEGGRADLQGTVSIAEGDGQWSSHIQVMPVIQHYTLCYVPLR
jgi:hypothetical protein